jgi:DNA-directed RNA polymerase omega subunit
VNKFEFVTLAGARARQLLAGSTPKVEGTDKIVKIAQREVREGKVERVSLTTGE